MAYIASNGRRRRHFLVPLCLSSSCALVNSSIGATGCSLNTDRTCQFGCGAAAVAAASDEQHDDPDGPADGEAFASFMNMTSYLCVRPTGTIRTRYLCCNDLLLDFTCVDFSARLGWALLGLIAGRTGRVVWRAC